MNDVPTLLASIASLALSTQSTIRSEDIPEIDVFDDETGDCLRKLLQTLEEVRVSLSRLLHLAASVRDATPPSRMRQGLASQLEMCKRTCADIQEAGGLTDGDPGMMQELRRRLESHTRSLDVVATSLE